MDETGLKLIKFKSPNLLNQMLPYASGQVNNPESEKKESILGKRKADQKL